MWALRVSLLAIILLIARLAYAANPTSVLSIQITPSSLGTIGLPVDRDASANWKKAGLQSIGGIPNRTTLCNGGVALNPIGGDNTANIQSAINACPVGQVLMLGTGTFTLSTCPEVRLNKAITIRGQGAGSTILSRTNGAIVGTLTSPTCPIFTEGGGYSIASTTTLASDAANGDLTVNVANVAGISAGSLVNVDELGISQAMPSPDWLTNPGGVAQQIWCQGDYRTCWNAHNPTASGFDSAGCLFGTNDFMCDPNGDAVAYSIRPGGVEEEYHLVTAVSGSIQPQAWNPSQTDASITLSGSPSLVTATRTTGSGSDVVSIAQDLESTNTYYFEDVVTNGTRSAVGLADTTQFSTGGYLGSTPHSLGYYQVGSVFVNGGLVATLASYAAGDNISCAVDKPHNHAWCRKNGGNWNNASSGQNPVGNVGGIDISSLGPAVGPAVNLYDSGNVMTGKFAPASWTYTAPTGFVQYPGVIGGAGTITFDSPLTLSYRTANSAGVEVFNPANLVQQAGIENLTMQLGGDGNVKVQGCIYCWLSNIESLHYLNPGIHFVQGAFRDLLTGSWAHEAAWPVNGGAGYSIALTYGASEILIDNNISMLANKVIVARASGSGSVVSYNYMDDAYINGNSGWVETGLNGSHLIGSHHMLFEGNRSFNADSDYTHGAAPYHTYFRNHLTGIRATFTGLDGVVRNDAAGCCSPLRAASTHPFTYWTSFRGNILGTPGVTTAGNGWDYKNNAYTTKHLLMLGWNDCPVVDSTGRCGPDDVANTIYPADPRTLGTTGTYASSNGCMADAVASGDPTRNCATIVSGNYDYVRNITEWASNDTSHTLPNSLYLTTVKPPYFTGVASVWPPIDPITPTINPIPAYARWLACQPPSASCMFTQP